MVPPGCSVERMICLYSCRRVSAACVRAPLGLHAPVHVVMSSILAPLPALALLILLPADLELLQLVPWRRRPLDGLPTAALLGVVDHLLSASGARPLAAPAALAAGRPSA